MSRCYLVKLNSTHVESFSVLLAEPDVRYWLYPEFRNIHYYDPLAPWFEPDLSGDSIVSAIVSENNDILGGLQIVNSCLSYFVGKPFWGQGIGCSAIQQSIARIASFNKLKAVVDRSNFRSRSILERHGFLFSGIAASQSKSVCLLDYTFR